MLLVGILDPPPAMAMPTSGTSYSPRIRDVLALSLSAALNAEIEDTKVGVFRM